MSDSPPDSQAKPLRKPLDSKAHLRPRFDLVVDMDVPSTLQRMRTRLAESENVRGMVLDSGRIELTSADDKVPFYSPQLVIDVVADGTGARLRARFGPHPHIWTLYMALYSTSLAFAIGCAMYGISQWIVGSDPWVLFLIPASFVLSGLVYGASYVGQGLGALQMQELRSFVERAIGSASRSSQP